jgi:exodeoxyribonuclease VII large subunit
MSTWSVAGPKRSGAERNGDDTVFRVAQLNRAVRMVLEQRWSNVWVAGELSDVSEASSGHVYCTLNDEDEPAQIRVVMFRNDARRSKARLVDGARVKFAGQLTLFTPRGGYQLIARVALPQGLGEMHVGFERLRKKLEAEGLLAPERKRALPRLPRVLGVVTSPTGAALHDIVRCAQSRCPVRIVVSPCFVQGNDAPDSIVAALHDVQQLRELDVVILGRGGGAADDLSAFNDERVARAIASCRVPVVSAVGHEVDISIADLVADVRAATPSNAAELVVPERRVLAAELRAAERALERSLEVRLGRARLRLERMAKQVRDPRATLARSRARLQRVRTRLAQLHAQRIKRERSLLAARSERLARSDPRLLMSRNRSAWMQLHTTLLRLARPIHARRREQLAKLEARLQALSPLGILARGYAIALHEPSGKALLRASDARPGDALTVLVHEGSLRAKVEPPA